MTKIDDWDQLVERMMNSSPIEVYPAGLHVVLKNKAVPSSQASLKQAVTLLPDNLPVDAKHFWANFREAHLLEDTTYGQAGLRIWSPTKVQKRNANFTGRRHSDMREGDLVIGEFKGDRDLVILRTNVDSSDYGHVVIALPIDPRGLWPTVATSLREFLSKYLNAIGRKYWKQ